MVTMISFVCRYLYVLFLLCLGGDPFFLVFCNQIPILRCSSKDWTWVYSAISVSVGSAFKGGSTQLDWRARGARRSGDPGSYDLYIRLSSIDQKPLIVWRRVFSFSKTYFFQDAAPVESALHSKT